ncbi:hypothetical protein DEO72_LG11g1795 [Vigna unguiculata]|uniref:Uncharacterized protein n=1 Tax=Vigna unguiculata TaxID=3917 RepID=A0A4D6NQJ5_VIGUN|nr:hypothetical protein DEO72_LG11g1795 [Vigna unguiculata]
METTFGELGDVTLVQSKLPKKLKKRTHVATEDGSTRDVSSSKATNLNEVLMCLTNTNLKNKHVPSKSGYQYIFIRFRFKIFFSPNYQLLLIDDGGGGGDVGDGGGGGGGGSGGDGGGDVGYGGGGGGSSGGCGADGGDRGCGGGGGGDGDNGGGCGGGCDGVGGGGGRRKKILVATNCKI